MARVTFVQLSCLVAPLVILQRRLQCKRLLANVALIRSLPGVGGPVLVKAGNTEERLSANLTVVGFVAALKMICQLLCGLATHTTNTSRVVHVAPDMFDQCVL